MRCATGWQKGIIGLCMIMGSAAGHAADTILDTAVAAGDFQTLAGLLKKADLVETLQGEGPFTVFAPTDEAFRNVPQHLLVNLGMAKRKKELAGVLTYHVISGRVELAQALKAGEAKTLAGETVAIRFEDGAVRINDAKLVTADIQCSNGIIHVIDTVLLPPGPKVPPAQVIDEAVKRGVPMFNRGDTAGCAAVYMRAVATLSAHARLDAPLRKALTGILNAAKEEHNASDRAWILRHGLDLVQLQLRNQRM